MDRDNNWDRVEKTYAAMVYGEGEKAAQVFDCRPSLYNPTLLLRIFTASTILSIFICPGTISLYELTIPTNGFLISSFVKPNALNNDL